MMGVGLSGSASSGKEILALTYAKETDHKLVAFDRESLFLPTRTKLTIKGVAKEYINVLSHLESAYMEAPSRFITDMTPIDVMAELYSLFAWYSVPSEDDDKMINQAWDYCCGLCTKYLSVIMHVQPCICNGREEQLNALTAGLIHTRLVNQIKSTMFTIRRNMVENDKRLNALKHFVHGNYIENSTYGISSSLKN